MSAQVESVSLLAKPEKSLLGLMLSFPKKFLAWNQALLFDYLDPFETETTAAASNKQAKGGKHKWSLLFPAMAIFSIFLLGTFYLEYEAKGRIDMRALPSSPTIFTRQIFPRGMWPQTDATTYIGSFGAFCLYLFFCKNPYILRRYTIDESKGQTVVRLGKTVFNVELSRKMIKSRRRIKRISRHLHYLFIGSGTLTFYVTLFVNNTFSCTVSQIIVFVFLLPFLTVYSLTGMFGLITFVILPCTTFKHEQKDLLRRQNVLNGQIGKSSKSGYWRIWKQYNQLSADLATYCYDLEQVIRYWVTPLSIFIITYMVIHGYLMYASLFVNTVPFLVKLFLLYSVFNIEICLFLLVDQCSRVGKLNRAIELANRRFFINSLKRGAFAFVGARNMLKAEARQLSRRLYPYSFQLFDGYRITSKTFYLVLVDTGTFFMLVFKNQ